MTSFTCITIQDSKYNDILLSPTSPCELHERDVTSLSNLKVVGALFTICTDSIRLWPSVYGISGVTVMAI